MYNQSTKLSDGNCRLSWMRIKRSAAAGAKFEARVICVINGAETEYENGAALYAYDFD